MNSTADPPVGDESLPHLAVGILSFNRVDEVLTSIDIIRTSDYPADRLHIVLVDNDSSDGTVEIVRSRYGTDVDVIGLTENRGALARNSAMLERDEPYIIIFDEDCAPDDSSTLRRAVQFMERHRDIGALAFQSLDATSGRPEYPAWDRVASRRFMDGGRLGVFVVGNGMLFRRDEVRRTIGYDQRIFWGSEEFCFALELLYHDVRTAYDPGIALRHRRAPRAMPSAHVLEAEARNNILAPFLHLPIPLAVLMASMHTAHRLAVHVVRGQRERLAAVRRGIGQALRLLPDVLSTRKVIPVGRLAQHNRWFVDALLR